MNFISFALTLFTGLIQLFLLIPFMLLVRRKNELFHEKYGTVFALLFLLDFFLIRSLNITLFDGQQWNWPGKAASLLWALIFIYSTKFLSKKEAGWTTGIESARSVFGIIFLLTGLRLVIRILAKGFTAGYDTETLLYEATLPGLSEEIVFRGIFLGLLNKAFGVKGKIGGTRFGWGLIITSVLFGLVHSLELLPRWKLVFNSQRFVMTGALGLVLGYIKEKSKSLLPGILFHNVWNIIAYWK